jgi:dTDP-4-dehydrorhamnose 3,5-epimerase
LLDGIVIRELKRFPDGRGFFSEVLRQDWADLLGEDPIVQVNLSYSYPGVVRAWHRHRRGQVDFFIVVQGAMRICAYDETSGALDEIVASEYRPQVVRIPGHYWHGTRTLGDAPSLLVYGVNRLYDYAAPDEERRPWNDPAIRDPATGAPYDWERLPHK